MLQYQLRNYSQLGHGGENCTIVSRAYHEVAWAPHPVPDPVSDQTIRPRMTHLCGTGEVVLMLKRSSLRSAL